MKFPVISKFAFFLLMTAVVLTTALIVWRVVVNPVQRRVSSDQVELPGKQASLGENLHQAYVAKALSQIEYGGDQRILERLEQDLKPLFAAVLEERSGEEYLEYFQSHNVELNQSVADARLARYREGPYRTVLEEEWGALSVSGRYGLVVGTGSRRGASWKSVGMDGVSAGLSHDGWPAAPEGMKSAMAFSAFRHPEDIPDLLAWFDFPVEFEQSHRCIVRLVLRWDDSNEVWVPYAGVTYTYSGTMPLLII